MIYSIPIAYEEPNVVARRLVGTLKIFDRGFNVEIHENFLDRPPCITIEDTYGNYVLSYTFERVHTAQALPKYSVTYNGSGYRKDVGIFDRYERAIEALVVEIAADLAREKLS